MVNEYLPPVITVPSSLIIVAITTTAPMVVTVIIDNPTTQANTYIAGMAVRLFVPRSYGMYQANNLVGTITSINGLDFTLNLDSSYFDPFVIPSGNAIIPATLSPAGSRNLQYNNTNVDIVPFQSLNNRGN